MKLTKSNADLMFTVTDAANQASVENLLIDSEINENQWLPGAAVTIHPNCKECIWKWSTEFVVRVKTCSSIFCSGERETTADSQLRVSSSVLQGSCFQGLAALRLIPGKDKRRSWQLRSFDLIFSSLSEQNNNDGPVSTVFLALISGVTKLFPRFEGSF